MQKKAKKSYQKPTLSALGSIEDITGWVAGAAGEYFGGNKTAKVGMKKGGGPADFGS
jgi:hypothetical protein